MIVTNTDGQGNRLNAFQSIDDIIVLVGSSYLIHRQVWNSDFVATMGEAMEVFNAVLELPSEDREAFERFLRFYGSNHHPGIWQLIAIHEGLCLSFGRPKK